MAYVKVIVDDILMEDFNVQYQEQNKILEAETEFSVFPKFNIIKVRSRKKKRTESNFEKSIF